MTSAPKEIWLEPVCDREDCAVNCVDVRAGRQWWEEDIWGKCAQCGRPPVKYVLADLQTELEETK